MELRILNLRDQREDAAVAQFLEDSKRTIKKETVNEQLVGPLIPELAHLDPNKRSILGRRKIRTVDITEDQDRDLPWKTAFSHLGKR